MAVKKCGAVKKYKGMGGNYVCSRSKGHVGRHECECGCGAQWNRKRRKT